MTPLPRPRPIAEITGIDRRRFDAEIRPAGQPVVLHGLAAEWPAVRAARSGAEEAVAYLKRFSHAEPVAAIVGAPEIEGRFFYTPDLTALNFTRGQSPLDPFLDRLLRDRDAARPYAMAVQSIPAPQLLPGFIEENRIDIVADAVTPRLWLGNAIRVAAHFDLMENIGIVVAGRRRFTLFPPDQMANLYMGPIELTPAGTPVSLVDLAAPDLDRFPRFAEAMAHAQEATLEPGDAIYIPYHWWHGVASLDPVNLFVNYWWNDARQDLGNPYDTLLHALFALRTLPADQREAWRIMFDQLIFRPDGDAFAHIPPEAQGVFGPADADNYQRMRATLLRNLA
ncbi:MAG: cupin-like domain-containing protein [Sphingomonas sp.]|uniref:cupin-like domain-containing protein n=1 Tax=Sphingomonas sp. TaxID=28214 RepID=UPI001AD4B2CF|nr:cupin-like domain-containing protein [Sphingomonas sp.]MBN8807846.1 cupin-like domain-containing protein [Sphingomonas sp.]